MLKTTKAPWRVSKKNPRKVINEHGVAISTCVLYSATNSRRPQVKDRNEAEANAQLIACAPELYNMLELIISEAPSQDDLITEGIKLLVKCES